MLDGDVETESSLRVRSLPRRHVYVRRLTSRCTVWYGYTVAGTVTDGRFTPANPVAASSCPSTGIRYPPRTSGGEAPSTGSVFYNVIRNGATNGCLISTGKWMVGVTCAGYTRTAASGGFTLTTSRGSCGISQGVFACGGVAATLFNTVRRHSSCPLSLCFSSRLEQNADQFSLFFLRRTRKDSSLRDRNPSSSPTTSRLDNPKLPSRLDNPTSNFNSEPTKSMQVRQNEDV